MPPSYNAPTTPPFAPPEFKEEEIKAEQLNTPYAEEVSQGNQAMAESSWTPPAAPEQSWQNQEIGQNTPLPPPPPVLPVKIKPSPLVSLVLGILSILPCCGFIIPEFRPVIVGFMAKSKAENIRKNTADAGLRWAESLPELSERFFRNYSGYYSIIVRCISNNLG